MASNLVGASMVSIDSRPARVRKAALTDWLRASLVAARGGEWTRPTEGKVVESLAERRRLGSREAARCFTRGSRGSREKRRGGGVGGRAQLPVLTLHTTPLVGLVIGCVGLTLFQDLWRY